MSAPSLAPIRIRPHGLCFDPEDACRHLVTVDPQLGALMERVGPFALRPEPTQSLFTALLRSIIYQQLSGKAAATILGRVNRLFAPRPSPTPGELLDISPERLREAGLSAAKTVAVRDLAARTLDGTV